MHYAFLIESVWHPPLFVADATSAALPGELELQALWFGGAFGREFRTTAGKPVRVVQFGEWNRGAGPDFIHAAVEIDGVAANGPVELDPDAASWEAHGHAVNPAFREVILHVAFRVGSREHFIRNCDHREVPQVIISDSQLADALNRPQRESAIAHPGRCVAPLRQMPASSVERLLDEASQHRAARKASRWLQVADAHGRDAALFQSVAETLGYRHNALAMRLLAQRVPLARIKSEPHAAEAALFGTAGFLAPDLHEAAPTDTRDYLRALWDTWWKLRPAIEPADPRAIPWKLHGQRPANHPHRRIGALLALAEAWPRFRQLALARPFTPKPLIDFLHGLDHPFWSRCHTLTSAQTPARLSLFGRNHAVELIANHLGPLALRESGWTFRDYRKLRHSAANDRVRRCALRLFGSEKAARPWTRRVCHHQALLQIYRDFCLEDVSDCTRCPFPEQLAQWR
jgi:hypothetical protein